MRIDQRLDPLGPTHPGLGPDGLHPVGKARDEAEVFLHMLLTDPAGRDDAPGRERKGRPENRLGQACKANVSSTVPPHFFTEDRAWW